MNCKISFILTLYRSCTLVNEFDNHLIADSRKIFSNVFQLERNIDKMHDRNCKNAEFNVSYQNIHKLTINNRLYVQFREICPIQSL